MDYKEVVSLIENSPFKCKQELLKTLLPSIRITTEKCNIESMALGVSRMGGILPDVPHSFEWPSWKNKDTGEQQYLDFIAQFNLKDLAGLEANRYLPAEGMLYFFYVIEDGPWGFDPKDSGCSKVIYCPEPAHLLERRIPPKSMEKTSACSMSFSEIWTIKDTLHEIDTQGDDTEDIFDLIYEISVDGIEHHLFGNPNTVQGDMQEECQLVTNGIYCGGGYRTEKAEALKSGIKDWKLLLQVDSDENPDWMWGDVGRIYFWIKEADLKAHDFDKVWLIFQCC
ncbi:DUF1963 domain-containing protein [bacterium]|nr:DUF1963 domain-containing protein [bacterium]QQR58419.1 MAG: DUF1963 domain-containing protein [Candidatus Melainabacteria bacterium]